jgi:hypothetical protein
MFEFRKLLVAIGDAINEWRRLQWNDLQFAEAPNALLALFLLIAIALFILLARGLRRRRAGMADLALPAVLPVMARPRLAATRHAAFLVFVVGLLSFAVALADPRTAFTREQVTRQGRRIALLVDGSTSMIMKFDAATLTATPVQGSPVFYTAVAAAERFMKLRINGPYRDLIALVQFGTYAYVVTPFTTDYENILLSLRLVGDPREWGRFDDSGTTIIQGIDEATHLFKSFDFVNSAGNLVVMFTDGRDSQTMLGGQSLDDVLAEAKRARIPIYMIRTAFKLGLGGVVQDKLWKAAVERTGGRFYAAADEETILRAVNEIDRLSPGRIELQEYSARRPRFSGYTLIAIGLWFTAALLKLGIPYFRTFP